MVRVLGIDPGLAATGIGVVTGSGVSVFDFSYGSIQTSPNMTLPNRLDHIYRKLSETIESARPDLMVVEDVFSLDKYPKSGITLGKVAGVVLLAGCRLDLAVEEVPVREAKQVLTGNGNAGKPQLEKAVRHLLKQQTPIRPYHASDALGLALIGLFRSQGRGLQIRSGP